MTRYKAAGIHLAISAVVGALALALLYFLWYPEPYFVASGGAKLATILIMVDVIIGPLLTLIVYQQGKKSLKFDLAVIALLQVGALGYGLSVMAQARPVYLVARIDRFLVVAANEIDAEDLQAASSEYTKLSWTGPRLVGALVPTDPDLQFDAMASGLAGRDLQHRPQFYVPYEEVRLRMSARGKPLDELAARVPGAQALIDEWQRRTGHPLSSVVYLPLDIRRGAITILLDASTGAPLGTLPIDPW